MHGTPCYKETMKKKTQFKRSLYEKNYKCSKLTINDFHKWFYLRKSWLFFAFLNVFISCMENTWKKLILLLSIFSIINENLTNF